MATTASQGHQADETWDEHYADEKDAAWLYRRLASVDTNRERGRSRSAGSPTSRTATPRSGKSSFATPAVRCRAYAVARRTRLLAWVAQDLRARRPCCR